MTIQDIAFVCIHANLTAFALHPMKVSVGTLTVSDYTGKGTPRATRAYLSYAKDFPPQIFLKRVAQL